jgi:hypothetical protein
MTGMNEKEKEKGLFNFNRAQPRPPLATVHVVMSYQCPRQPRGIIALLNKDNMRTSSGKGSKHRSNCQCSYDLACKSEKRLSLLGLLTEEQVRPSSGNTHN